MPACKTVSFLWRRQARNPAPTGLFTKSSLLSASLAGVGAYPYTTFHRSVTAIGIAGRHGSLPLQNLSQIRHFFRRREQVWKHAPTGLSTKSSRQLASRAGVEACPYRTFHKIVTANDVSDGRGSLAIQDFSQIVTAVGVAGRYGGLPLQDFSQNRHVFRRRGRVWHPAAT